MTVKNFKKVKILLRKTFKLLMFLSPKTRLTEFTFVTIVLELSTTCTVNTIYLEEYLDGCEFNFLKFFVTLSYSFGKIQN